MSLAVTGEVRARFASREVTHLEVMLKIDEFLKEDGITRDKNKDKDRALNDTNC